MERRTHRRGFLLAGLLLTTSLVVAARAASLSADERAASARYVAGMQNPDGGFRAGGPSGPSALPNVVPALRALHYFGGHVRNTEALLRFTEACYKPSGFSSTPGGETTVRTTAMGMITLAELNAPQDPRNGRTRALVGYLDRHATGLEEIYISEAALDAAKLKAPRGREWMAAFEAVRHPDGTYGANVSDTAHAVCTALRLGLHLRDRAATVRALRAAQHADGGFSTEGDTSDLATSYPVMRAFYMLRERPDLARVRAFVASCRNTDGGYGARPGTPSAVAPTYFASIILHWVDELER